MRACEVAADPTNALALEAAVRRLAEPAGIVRLAAVQRVVRAQQTAPGYLPHFGLLGLATAGRDRGGRRFEREAVAEHVSALAAGLAAAGLAPAQLALTPLSAAGESVAAAVAAELAGPLIEVIADPQRQSGRGYYRDFASRSTSGPAGSGRKSATAASPTGPRADGQQQGAAAHQRTRHRPAGGDDASGQRRRSRLLVP